MRKDTLVKKKALVLDKLRESAVSVLPIILTVTVLCLTAAPITADLLLSFLIGSLMIVVGIGLFSLGADMSMTLIGSKIGTALTKSRRMWFILLVSFILGIAITVSEPDLQVLADTVPHINNFVLIMTVSIGVGLFLAICMFRIIHGVRLRWLLMFFYALVFVLAMFSDPDFLGIAFDAGGVTTGPMTVPFILALGVGVANIRSDSKAEADSFGLVALCSIGPILAVLVLGFFYKGDASASLPEITGWSNTVEIGKSYFAALPKYMGEIAISLSPIVVIFLIFQFFSFKLPKKSVFKILLGILYTYIGLVLFLTGVNVGFSSLGTVLGGKLAEGNTKYILIPLAMLMGWFIISAEPAVHVLKKQIEEVSAGAISGRAITVALSIAISLAMGLSMLRVVTGISVMWFLIPGYLIALVLSFFVPDIFTAIAFDSGGVASGPMTATFMLQFMMGACSALGGNILTDSFGLVAMVAMMPLISIQILGFIYTRKKSRANDTHDALEGEDVIELWN